MISLSYSGEMLRRGCWHRVLQHMKVNISFHKWGCWSPSDVEQLAQEPVPREVVELETELSAS